MHDQPNNNGPNLKLNYLYGNARMNWMRNNGTLKFTRAHMNSILVEKWEAFKILSATITQEYFKKTHLPTLLYWTNARTTKVNLQLLKLPMVRNLMI